MKKVIIVMMAILVAFGLAACEFYDTPSSETEYTAELQTQIENMYGFPTVSNFFEYTQLKEIYELRDNPELVRYWYTKNNYTGKFVYQGSCIGYGIPYGASITAPEASFDFAGNGSGWKILPQAEPNGLYTNGVTSSATWILNIGSDGEIEPVYIEFEIAVFPEKLDDRMVEEWSLIN